MTLVDVIIGTAIMLTVFLSIFGAFKLSIDLIYSTKAKAGAIALVANRLEYIRGLPYPAVGIVGGIPAGALAPVATTTMNGVVYTLSTLILYTDDPADGAGDGDENNITADYKTVKVEASWSVRDSLRTTFAVTVIAPVGVETLDAGGTLKVNVIDAATAPISGASVRIVNATTVPAIDVTAATNSSGTVSFPGAPAAGGYEITASKTGYSTAQTYTASIANPNPSPGAVAVADQQISTLTLSIDRTGSLTTRTFSPPEERVFADTFDDASKLSVYEGTEVLGGALVLSIGEEGYRTTGEARSVAIAPPYLASWDVFAATTSAPAGTTLSLHLYYASGDEYVLVPESDLPGNSAGLVPPIDLSGLPTTYTSLQIGVSLGTLDPSVTPAVSLWSLSYLEGPIPLPDVTVSIHGLKTIGTTAQSAPIYKYTETFTTDASGVWTVNPIEWDGYAVVPETTYDVSERCPHAPAVQPGVDATLSFILMPRAAHSLLVYVTGSGAALPDALVSLESGGSETSLTTSACGQAFFSNVSPGDYTLNVVKLGYQPFSQPISVSGTIEAVIPLSP